MKVYAADYYEKFKCIADKCKHSCCVGWEIDIDEESLERYRGLKGEFGDKVRKNISFNADVPHFITDDSEKCPFLNECGLCDMIIELGEDSLCEICDQHPRFRNFFSDRVEIGLGLCCEAAAELVLSATDKVGLTELEESDSEEEQADIEEQAFFAQRSRWLEILQDRERTFLQRLGDLQRENGVEHSTLSIEEKAELFGSLEYMSSEFGERIVAAIRADREPVLENTSEIPMEQLAVYFIMRHTADGIYSDDMPERIAFCAMCTEIVYRVTIERMESDSLGFLEAFCDTAREFSSEIEYSTENTDRLIEAMM